MMLSQSPIPGSGASITAQRDMRAGYCAASACVTTDDRMIPPPAQRQMAKRASATVVEVKGSHAIYVSQPQAVIKLIEQAAKGAE
jgi:hypothetical protein